VSAILVIAIHIKKTDVTIGATKKLGFYRRF